MIRTAGGRFRPDERPIYFAASGRHGEDNNSMPEHVLVAVNELMTPSSERLLEDHFDKGRCVLLDSGIFWLTNEHKRDTGCTMDQALSLAPEDIRGFDQLFDRYVYLTRKYGDQLWGYIELDQGGMVNKRRTRARLHDLGLNPMPVYHPLNDWWDYFDEIAENYDRMCMGNVVQAHSAVRLRLLHTLWERHLKYPDLWVHVLGLSANPHCFPCPPDSCDSSTWIAGFRWKTITESAMLRPLGEMGQEWRYTTAEKIDTHLASYAENMTHMNLMWSDVLCRQDELGAPHYPQGLNPPVVRPA